VNRTQQLREIGQSLWLDSVSRRMLDGGVLQRYIHAHSITGLTSNPTIFDQAIGAGPDYDGSIRSLASSGRAGEELFVELALEDLRRAADLFRPAFEATGGADGWVSMEVSPLLADDTRGSIDAAKRIHAQADRPNLFVKIPGTPAGIPAIEESIYAGVPINVTLLFSREQYESASQAYLRGIERRIAAGLSPRVPSVASLFVSRWDKAVADRAPHRLRNRLGIAIAGRTYRAYREMLVSPRWQALEDAGARPQILLWASTGTKDRTAPDTLYVEALAAPDTIDTMPPQTLEAFADHGSVGRVMGADGGDAEDVLEDFTIAGIDVDALALQLQREGADAFVSSWNELLARLGAKTTCLSAARA
jgi:transaldolase